MFNSAEMTISDHVSAQTVSRGKKSGGGEVLWSESLLKTEMSQV